jgi:hypothetical protein
MVNLNSLVLRAAFSPWNGFSVNSQCVFPGSGILVGTWSGRVIENSDLRHTVLEKEQYRYYSTVSLL